MRKLFDYAEAAFQPWFSRARRPMRLPDDILKSVVFIGLKADGKFVPKATGFIVTARDRDFTFFYLVTAEHVISHLSAGGNAIYVRVNTTNGGATDFEMPFNMWRFHPDTAKQTDIAVTFFDARNPKAEYDFKVIPLERGPQFWGATKEVITGSYIGPGDEIAIIGLFRSHHGADRNIPIVRIGNIASMSNEPVYTEYCGYTDAYLIEARSISGLSGSPVFVVRGPLGEIPNNMDPARFSARRYFLLGLMHGHFDVKNLREDMADAGAKGGGINTGIGVVIPCEKILEAIDQPEFVELRTMMIEKKRKEAGAKPDVISDDQPDLQSTDENPKHREDFMRLQSVAARKQQRDD
jgi:hypothetical protein